MVVPGLFAPLLDPEKLIGGFGFPFSVFSDAVVRAGRFGRGGADTFADCCSNRRRSALGAEVAGALATGTLFADLATSGKCLTRGRESCAAQATVRTARANPRTSVCLISQSPAFGTYSYGCMHPSIHILSLSYVNPFSAKLVADNLKPVKEIPGIVIADSGVAPGEGGSCSTR